VGDTRSISQPLAASLLVDQGVHLLTRRRMSLRHRLLLRQRALRETLDGPRQTSCQSDHPRHRSPVTFLVHPVCGLMV
jgi:hypothetical protein